MNLHQLLRRFCIIKVALQTAVWADDCLQHGLNVGEPTMGIYARLNMTGIG
jgi:hypothetical protein